MPRLSPMTLDLEMDQVDALHVLYTLVDAFAEVSKIMPAPASLAAAMVLFSSCLSRVRPLLEEEKLSPATREVLRQVEDIASRFLATGLPPVRLQ